MKIAIITKYPFPHGMAATNRIAAYTKGLSEAGVEVTVITVEPTDSFDTEPPHKGTYGEVRFIYPSGRAKSKYKIGRALAIYSGYRFLKGVLNSFSFLQKEKFDTCIISNDTPRYLWVYSRMIHLLGGKSLFIFDEYPNSIRHKGLSNLPKREEKKYRSSLRRVDGYISISKELEDFFCSILPKKTLLQSIIVDTERFSSQETSETNQRKYLCYLGNMDLEKDNIDNIVHAYAQIKDAYPQVDFRIYGPKNNRTESLLKELINSYHLEDRVSLCGPIPSTEVPQVLCNALVLVSSQKNTLRNSGGLSTKFGEYLATGVPSLFTDVGEKSVYAKDDQEIFYALPDNVADYTNKLRSILDNYPHAQQVAQKGRTLVENTYSHVAAGKRIKEFIETL